MCQDSPAEWCRVVTRRVAATAAPYHPPQMSQGPRASGEPGGRGGPLAASAAILVACILQAPGRLAADTKLDLAIAPLRFLGRTLRLWQPEAAFGHIQNQSVGYLFPMGPFFAIGDGVGLPMWLVQRLWMATLLLVAFWGVLRLAKAFAIGSPGSRLAAAATYALSPAMLVVIGSTSGGQVPAALLPWAVLPLVRGAAEGSPRRAAARSGLAIAAMGGINAASTLSVLPLPALWLLTRRGPRARALLRWWVLVVPAACLWWLVPLVLQVRYGTDFLPFTESATTTTATASATEAIRGTGHWLAYLFSGGEPWLPGGWGLHSVRIAIVATVVLAGAGLWGLARRDMPERTFLVLGVAVGFVAVVAGYAGPVGGGLAGLVRDGLDGPLGAFRNVSKFEPLLRLPLALGLAHAVSSVAMPRVAGAERMAAGAIVAALIAAAALPLTRAQTVPPGSFPEIPAHWEEAADWVHARAGGGGTLLAPSAAFAEYDWGRPLDEPFQALARSPWAVRNLVPLGTSGLTRLLDEVDARLARGDAGPGFAPGLARAGVRFLVVRNDLDPARTAAPPPVQVRDALAMAPGLRLVRSFGPVVRGRANTDRLSPSSLTTTPTRFRALDVYEVADWHGPVEAYPASPTVLSGGPEQLFDVADHDAVVLAGDDTGDAPPAGRVVTDGFRRRDVGFGDVRLDASYVLTPDEPAPGATRPPRDRLPLEGTVHQTTARMTGAVTLRSTSFGPTTVRLPELQPFAAFDGDLTSAWVAQGPDGPLRERIDVALSRAVDPGHLTVRLLDDPRWSRITRLRVSTPHGARTTRLRDTDGPQLVVVPAGSTRSLSIEIAGVIGPFGAGLREVAIPGVEIDRSLRLPADQDSAAPNAWLLHRGAADPFDATRGDEEPRLRRTIVTGRPVTLRVTGTARAKPGPALDALLAPAAAPLSMTASSVWKQLPAFSAAAATDGDPSTAWVADPADEQPALTLRWPEPVGLDRVEVVAAAGAVRRPTVLRLLSPDGDRRVRLPSSGVARFPALRTTSVVLEVLDSAELRPRLLGLVTPAATGMAELRFAALDGIARPDATPMFDLPCGQGPPVLVDGRTIPTEVRGTTAAVRGMRPVTVAACEPITLTPGAHRVDGAPDGALVIDALSLVPETTASTPSAAPRRTVRAVTWNAERRRVSVGPGATTWLTFTENFNDGWRADLDGRDLTAVRVDGWRQGFVVPEGSGGTVRLTFAPGRTYATGLGVGAVALLLLVIAALVRGEGAAAAADRRRVPNAVAFAGALAAAFLAGGPVVAAVAVLVFFRGRIGPAWIAGTYGAAGAVAVWQPGRFPADHAGTFGPVAQALTVVAVAALVLSLADDP